MTDHRHLAHLFVGDATVVMLGEVHLGPVHAFEEASETADLVDRARSQELGDFGVPAADGYLHGVSSRSAVAARTMLEG